MVCLKYRSTSFWGRVLSTLFFMRLESEWGSGVLSCETACGVRILKTLILRRQIGACGRLADRGFDFPSGFQGLAFAIHDLNVAGIPSQAK